MLRFLNAPRHHAAITVASASAHRTSAVANRSFHSAAATAASASDLRSSSSSSAARCSHSLHRPHLLSSSSIAPSQPYHQHRRSLFTRSSALLSDDNNNKKDDDVDSSNNASDESKNDDEKDENENDKNDDAPMSKREVRKLSAGKRYRLAPGTTRWIEIEDDTKEGDEDVEVNTNNNDDSSQRDIAHAYDQHEDMALVVHSAVAEKKTNDVLDQLEKLQIGDFAQLEDLMLSEEGTDENNLEEEDEDDDDEIEEVEHDDFSRAAITDLLMQQLQSNNFVANEAIRNGDIAPTAAASGSTSASNASNSSSASSPSSSNGAPNSNGGNDDNAANDWGSEFFPTIVPNGGLAPPPFPSKTNAPSANAPRPSTVYYCGVEANIIQFPGQPIRVSLPPDLITSLLTRARKKLAKKEKKPQRGELIGLFFTKSKEVRQKQLLQQVKNEEIKATIAAAAAAAKAQQQTPSDATSTSTPSNETPTTDTTSKAVTIVDSPSASSTTTEVSPLSSTTTSPSVPSSSAIITTPATTSAALLSSNQSLLTRFEPVGLLAEILTLTPSTGDCLLLCHRRIMLDRSKETVIARSTPSMEVYITHHDDLTWSQSLTPMLKYDPELLEVKTKCLAALRNLRALEGEVRWALRSPSYVFYNPLSPGAVIDYWGLLSGSMMYLDPNITQKTRSVLGELDLVKRMRIVLELLQHELRIVTEQKVISDEMRKKVVQEKMALLVQQRANVEKKLAALNRQSENTTAFIGSTSSTASGTDPNSSSSSTTAGTTSAPDMRSEKEKLMDKWAQRLKALTIPIETLNVIDETLSRFQSIDSDSSFEYATVRNYLDWLTQVPFGVYTPEMYDIKHAEKVLAEDHYGMDDVKERILEFIATSKLAGKQAAHGKILCLLGPPGTGKTSIAKSIARALDRKFYRISVGGTDDVSEIKGHRRTYVGSMPGKLIQALKLCGSSNPVILIDEIDKTGRGGGTRGDPSSALLEVLDPEQNSNFLDHYLDVPVDLSKVLFIATANDRSTIPGPLADRMDFIELSGYLANEKVKIASQYLEPAIRKTTGVTKEQLEIQQDALFHLIRWYCREAGVRSLQKYLERIYRKVALVLAKQTKAAERVNAQSVDPSDPTLIPSDAVPTSPSTFTRILLTPSNLKEYAGPQVYQSDKLYEVNPIGVATGLAYTSHGGVVLFIESVVADVMPHVNQSGAAERVEAKDDSQNKRRKRISDDETEENENEDEDDANPTKTSSTGGGYSGRGELFCTGQLGDVMKESSSIAYTVAKRILAQRTSEASPSRHFFDQHRVHLHFPSGATPKDGPSAGISMVTSLLSLALGTPPIRGHAMTGELTLTGLVLPIGGVKEKIMAARHAGLNLIILPDQNRKDVHELSSYVTEGMEIRFVKTYDEVFNHIFPDYKEQQIVVPQAIAKPVRQRKASTPRQTTPTATPAPPATPKRTRSKSATL